MSLKGTQTEQNLKDAFAGESQANRRYLYFAQRADVEGYNDVSVVFRSTAEGETGHAHGHLEYLEETGDPATGLPIGGTADNLRAAIAGETHEYTDMYPGMARTAREDGLDEIAETSRRLSFLMDTEDVIKGKYNLHVSSPGTSRALVLPRQYPHHIGRDLRVTYNSDSEETTIVGILSAVGDDAITLTVKGEDNPTELPFSAILEALVELPW